MSFFSEKVLKRPPVEEIRGYSPRELEIAKKNYNYGHNVCFYTVMVCFIIWAILCSVFRPDVAHASELVGGDEPIETPYNNYLVFYSDSQDGNNHIFVFADFNVQGDYIYANHAYSLSGAFSISDVVDSLKNGTVPDCNINSGTSFSSFSSVADLYYSDVDFKIGDKSFQATPYLIHQERTVGGLAAPEIAKATVIQILGLVPLVLGLVVSVIGLRKALAMVFQRLRRA